MTDVFIDFTKRATVGFGAIFKLDSSQTVTNSGIYSKAKANKAIKPIQQTNKMIRKSKKCDYINNLPLKL